MKYIKISNQGLLDIKLVPLMGGTTKLGDETKIGQFGTGLKYALAFFIRNHVDFKIFIGQQEVKVSSNQEIIANQTFNIIYINDERTSITAQMGYDWSEWMILREIWCNALDEGNAQRSIVENPHDLIERKQRDGDNTYFYIEYTPAFAKVWQQWTNYFVQDFEPIYNSKDYAIYMSNGPLKLYKHGVLILESKEDKKSLFNYDLKNAEINELRQYTDYPGYDIGQCLNKLEDVKVIRYFLENVTEDHYEGNKYFDNYYKFSDAWKEAIGNAKIIHQEAIDNIKAKGLDIDLSSVLNVPRNIYKALTKCFDGIGALRTINKINEFYEIHDPETELQIKQGLVILETCNYYIDPELKFTYGTFGDKTILAQVNTDKKEILISENLRNKSLFEVVTTIVEENEHFKTNFQDKTRAFQQHFINLYTKTLLDKHEIKL